MYYRILSADENVRADEWFVKKDADTGITLVSRDTLPASDDGLQNKIVFDADGTLYRYDICGKPQIVGKTQKSIKSIFRSQCRRTSAINEQSAWRTRKLSEVERTASVRYGTTLFGFASYLRIDKENLTAYPYRLCSFPKRGRHGKRQCKNIVRYDYNAPGSCAQKGEYTNSPALPLDKRGQEFRRSENGNGALYRFRHRFDRRRSARNERRSHSNISYRCLSWRILRVACVADGSRKIRMRSSAYGLLLRIYGKRRLRVRFHKRRSDMDSACGKRRHSFHSARRSCRKKTYRT